ncbi:hypothetical protein L6452_04509 [Arctium lappa]|uniref:Uncharacterized protein n=1 Tax=Arctium lappa TaxID=4217 RepID=A0ACB9EDT7_ARCLA|nr:hypothetical protein L6452_04509 [Arctium lappa]
MLAVTMWSFVFDIDLLRWILCLLMDCYYRDFASKKGTYGSIGDCSLSHMDSKNSKDTHTTLLVFQYL